MRKAKSFKNLNLKKYSTVKLTDEIELPLRTLSISEEASITLKVPYDIPTRTRPATVAEKEELKRSDPNYNDKIFPMIKVYDETSTQYQQYKSDLETYQPILEAIKYIDMDATIDDSGISLWQDLGITPNDWFSLAKYFGEELGLSLKDYEKIYMEVKSLLGEGLFEKLKKIQAITNLSYYELLNKLEKLTDEEVAKLEKEDSNISTEVEIQPIEAV